MEKNEKTTDLDKSIEKATAGIHSSPRSSSPKPRSFGKRSFGRRDTPVIRGVGRKTEDVIPPIEGDNIRIIPLGGVEEIGRNMTMIEYKGDIIVVDIGFQFKDEDTPGIDYILPNTKYLEDNKERIKAVFITHGHLDHIGGLPFIIDRIGYPKIYTRQFGAIMIQKRQDEFPHLQPLDIQIIEGSETITCGALKIKTFPISHTIPDSMGLIIETPHGNIVFIEDVRVDNVNGVPTEEEVEQYKMFKNMKTLLLTMDSTSIEKPGFSLSENVVVDNIDKFIRDTKSRLIIATFASQVERIISIIKSTERYGKKLVIEGRSMKSNIEIIKQLKLADVKNIIPLEEIENYPPDRIVMLVTGAQGEEFAALMRIANKTHKHVRLRPTDTVLLSASVIPTNHKSVVNLKDNLYRSGAKIVTYLDSDIHASGHGNRDELKWIHQQIPYKFFMPVHGNHYMLCQHAELSYSLGHSKEDVIVPDNGSIIEIYDNGEKIRVLKEKVPAGLVLVDGFAVGNMQEMVIRDRKMLAQDGIFLIVVSLNTKTGKLKKSPDIISRGFVYLRESQDLLNHTRMIIKKTVEDTTKGMNPIDFDLIKGTLVDDVGRYLFQQTAKKPIVIPVILGV
ncbi:MAG TPA: ribonuclease J [Parcubacteria group bacterium]|jgi:ribonuclease J|nr:ribonuclease J [Parcubacteria group bacterium]